MKSILNIIVRLGSGLDVDHRRRRRKVWQCMAVYGGVSGRVYAECQPLFTIHSRPATRMWVFSSQALGLSELGTNRRELGLRDTNAGR